MKLVLVLLLLTATNAFAETFRIPAVSGIIQNLASLPAPLIITVELNCDNSFPTNGNCGQKVVTKTIAQDGKYSFVKDSISHNGFFKFFLTVKVRFTLDKDHTTSVTFDDAKAYQKFMQGDLFIQLKKIDFDLSFADKNISFKDWLKTQVDEHEWLTAAVTISNRASSMSDWGYLTAQVNAISGTFDKPLFIVSKADQPLYFSLQFFRPYFSDVHSLKNYQTVDAEIMPQAVPDSVSLLVR